jgi:hypothetical protein
MPDSWIASGRVPDVEDRRGLDWEPNYSDAPAHVQHQMDAAVDAVRQLVGSGSIGEGEEYVVSLSGQASEEHTGVVEVGAIDTLTVSVSAVRHQEQAE